MPANRGLGFEFASSIWPTAGMFTRRVVIQIPLLSCAEWQTLLQRQGGGFGELAQSVRSGLRSAMASCRTSGTCHPDWCGTSHRCRDRRISHLDWCRTSRRRD